MYKRSEHGWLKHLDFIILDALCAQGALLLAYGFRFQFAKLAYEEPFYQTMAVWIALFGVLIAIMFNTMHNVLRRGWLTEIRQTITQSALVFASLIIYLFSMKDSENASRIVAWLMLVIYTVLAFGVRMLWKWLLLHRRSNRNGRAMLLVADEATAEKTIARFHAHSIENINVCGVVLVDRDAKGETVSGIPVSANLDEAAQYICREWIDEVYISVADSSLLPHTLMAQCGEMGVTLHLQMPALGAGKQVIEKVAGRTVITSSINFASPLQLLLKRIMDLLSGLILSLLALLAIVFIGPIIKKKSPGPILYKQERIGQNGRRFIGDKIRTIKVHRMYLDMGTIHQRHLWRMHNELDFIELIGFFRQWFSGLCSWTELFFVEANKRLFKCTLLGT